MIHKLTNMEYHYQEEANWCYAAIQQMVEFRYHNRQTPQCHYAAELCGKPDDYCCKEGEKPKECLQKGYFRLPGSEYSSQSSNTPVPYTEIIHEINANYPLIVAGHVVGNPHYYLIIGYYSDKGEKIVIWDPYFGRGEQNQSYGWYKQTVAKQGDYTLHRIRLK